MLDLNKWTVFIPAAGYGTRMGERCFTHQKCMLPIWEDKKPILYHIINNLKIVGCHNFVIAVNHCKDEIQTYFGDGRDFGIKITYVEGFFTSTYDTLCDALNVLPERFIYSHGDMIFQPILYLQLLNMYKTNFVSTLALMPNNNLVMTHPQLTISDNKITSIHFDAAINEYPYMFLGGAIYNKCDFIQTFNNDRSGMVEKVVQQKLEKHESLNAIVYTDEWRHLMDEQDYLVLLNEYKWIKEVKNFNSEFIKSKI